MLTNKSNLVRIVLDRQSCSRSLKDFIHKKEKNFITAQKIPACFTDFGLTHIWTR